MVQNETHSLFCSILHGAMKNNKIYDNIVLEYFQLHINTVAEVMQEQIQSKCKAYKRKTFTLLTTHCTVQTPTDRNIYNSKQFIWTYCQFEAQRSFPLLEAAKCLLCSSHFPERTEED